MIGLPESWILKCIFVEIYLCILEKLTIIRFSSLYLPWAITQELKGIACTMYYYWIYVLLLNLCLVYINCIQLFFMIYIIQTCSNYQNYIYWTNSHIIEFLFDLYNLNSIVFSITHNSNGFSTFKSYILNNFTLHWIFVQFISSEFICLLRYI